MPQEKPLKMLKFKYLIFLRQSLIIIFLASGISLTAQTSVINLELKDVPLTDILLEIKNQTNKRILFSNDFVGQYKHESISLKNASLSEALNAALQNKSLSYRIVDEVIIIESNKSEDKTDSKPLGILQTIRGTIVDRESKSPLTGANIVILGSDPLIGNISDKQGDFRLEEVPLGRHTLRVSFIGFQDFYLPEILVGSAKEVILTIELIESIEDINEVVVRPYAKGSPGNDMAVVSARSFTTEEAGRIAGSVNDPGRAALSFAGVNTDDDFSNQIVIRGNSPNSMLWRIEGVEIPIPNHFFMEGWDAGYVSILSADMMGKTDFYTGAFPAEFGNGTSGVFDISLRNGNNERRESSFEFGFLGADICLEGPLSKNNKSSYLINYRYATFSIMNLIGIRIDGDLLPDYTDLSFKFNFPTKKYGTFSIWGLGGRSYIGDEPIADSTKWEYEFMNSGYYTNTYMGATGISHTLFPDQKSYFKTIISFSGNLSHDHAYSLDENYKRDYHYDELLSSGNIRFSSLYNRKLNSRFSFRTGIILSQLYYDYSSDYRNMEDVWENDIEGNDATQMYQAFLQTKVRLHRKLHLTAGVHYLHFALNGENSFEPRAGLRWNLPQGQTLNFGMGLHSRRDYLMTYFTKMKDYNGLWYYPNNDLSLQKSLHYVLGYTKMFKNDLKFQVETYYQALSNLPVSSDTSKTWSPINDDIFGFDFVSEGEGMNYGIEFTLEKYFTNNYYFLITNSLFESKYKPLDGKWYSTRYNNRYITNLVGGKEWIFNNKNVLGVNTRFIWSGGRRGTPVDTALIDGNTYLVEDQQLRNTRKYKDYLRWDLGISYTLNNPKVSHKFTIDIQNVTSHENEGGSYYSMEMDEEIIYTLQGIIPSFSYKISF